MHEGHDEHGCQCGDTGDKGDTMHQEHGEHGCQSGGAGDTMHQEHGEHGCQCAGASGNTSAVATAGAPPLPPVPRRTLDVRGLAPPEPFDRTMQALKVLPDDFALEQMVDRVPVHLLTGLTDMGFNFVVNEVGAETRVVIWRRRDGEAVCGLTDTPTPSVAGTDVDSHPDGSRRVDVRHLPTGEKHPTIFGAFDRLAVGEAFVLLNDHDPRPLRFQFDAQRPGRFTWEYLEEGPEEWSIRISRR